MGAGRHEGASIMPLQNRVDPFGEIHAIAARGLFTGNRGVIHDPATKTLQKRRWATRAWIVCVCEFRGQRREVMGRNAPSGNAGWTELFFLDEVTALAAGHRPCFYCRRERAKAFADAMGKGLGTDRPSAPQMDARLHRERLASGGTQRGIAAGLIGDLPDGAMLAKDGRPFAKRGARLLPWTFDGYGEATSAEGESGWNLVTPPATIAALTAGYQPVWHPSAD
jgi:hypothetical protein